MADDRKDYAHADLQYVDGRSSDLPLGSTNVYENAYILLNARLIVILGPGQLNVFVRNLTNEVAILNTSNSGGPAYQTINQPRTAGAVVRRSF